MKLFQFFVASVMLFALTGHALSQEKGSKDDAKALAEAAVTHVKRVGIDQAFRDFTLDKTTWSKKDIYVFVNDFAGVTKAHGANERLIGKSLLELKDQNGKLFIKEMTELAKSKGSGWVEYDWAHPQTKRVEGKTTYVLRIPAYEGYIGVGVYR